MENLCVKSPNEKSNGWKCTTLLFQMALVGQFAIAIFFGYLWVKEGRYYPDYSYSPGVTNKGVAPLLVHGPIACIMFVDFWFNSIVFKPAHLFWHLFMLLVWLGVNAVANLYQKKELSNLLNYTQDK